VSERLFRIVANELTKDQYFLGRPVFLTRTNALHRARIMWRERSFEFFSMRRRREAARSPRAWNHSSYAQPASLLQLHVLANLCTTLCVTYGFKELTTISGSSCGHVAGRDQGKLPTGFRDEASIQISEPDDSRMHRMHGKLRSDQHRQCDQHQHIVQGQEAKTEVAVACGTEDAAPRRRRVHWLLQLPARTAQ
jgi:hypothetical protein